jgi:hypothetical protein
MIKNFFTDKRFLLSAGKLYYGMMDFLNAGK